MLILDNESKGLKVFIKLLKYKKIYPLMDLKKFLSSRKIIETYNYYTFIKNGIRLPYNDLTCFFHVVILSLCDIDQKLNVLRTWNNALSELITIDFYVDNLINTLKNNDAYDDILHAYSIYFKKELDESNIKNILKHKRTYDNTNSPLSFLELIDFLKCDDSKNCNIDFYTEEFDEYEMLIEKHRIRTYYDFKSIINDKLHEIFSKEICLDYYG